MHAYWQLFRKEVRQALGSAIVFAILMVAWLVFLFTRVGVWPSPVPFVLGLMVIGFLPFWALWRSFYSFRQEWTGDHMYLLLSLPVPGWYFTGTKLLIALIELFVYSLVVVGGSFLLLAGGQAGAFPVELFQERVVYTTALQLALIQTGALVIAMVVVQSAYLFGRLAKKRKGLLTAGLTVVGSWLVVRAGGLLTPLFTWFPNLRLHSITVTSTEMQMTAVSVGIAPFVGVAVAALLLFFAASYVLERDIEL